MPIDLTGYTEEELIELNRRVVERIKVLREQRCASAMTEFGVGDRVSFHPECGHEVIGTVIRLNRQSVTVVTTEGRHWRVAPGFLKKVERERHDPPNASLQRNLLDLNPRQSREHGKA
jgi:hypothetical protein